MQGPMLLLLKPEGGHRGAWHPSCVSEDGLNSLDLLLGLLCMLKLGEVLET